eukprot:3794803-Ditylum_brightwellii.AAC.1
MQDVHAHTFPLHVFVPQTWYMRQALIKPHKKFFQNFVACINSINDQLEQVPPREARTLQVKLVNDNLMDIIESTMPKSWQGEVNRQCFDCMAERQVNFIRFNKNLELLDPPKQAQRGRTAAISSTSTNQQIQSKKRGREANAPILSA